MKVVDLIIFNEQGSKPIKDTVQAVTLTSKKNTQSTNLDESNTDWRVKFKTTLNKLGITTTLKGYQTLYYIMDGMCNSPNSKEYISTKQVYAPAISRMNSTYSKVERNIRYVKERIYNNNSREDINRILGISTENNSDINNGHFISILSDVVFN